jgi:hypothetical protein
MDWSWQWRLIFISMGPWFNRSAATLLPSFSNPLTPWPLHPHTSRWSPAFVTLPLPLRMTSAFHFENWLVVDLCVKSVSSVNWHSFLSVIWFMRWNVFLAHKAWSLEGSHSDHRREVYSKQVPEVLRVRDIRCYMVVVAKIWQVPDWIAPVSESALMVNQSLEAGESFVIHPG